MSYITDPILNPDLMIARLPGNKHIVVLKDEPFYYYRFDTDQHRAHYGSLCPPHEKPEYVLDLVTTLVLQDPDPESNPRETNSIRFHQALKGYLEGEARGTDDLIVKARLLRIDPKFTTIMFRMTKEGQTCIFEEVWPTYEVRYPLSTEAFKKTVSKDVPSPRATSASDLGSWSRELLKWHAWKPPFPL